MVKGWQCHLFSLVLYACQSGMIWTSCYHEPDFHVLSSLQGIENLSTLRPVQLLGIRAVKRALPGLSTYGCMTLGSSVYLMYSGVEHKLNM